LIGLQLLLLKNSLQLIILFAIILPDLAPDIKLARIQHPKAVKSGFTGSRMRDSRLSDGKLILSG
jgi:hypothetical protein